MEAAPPALTERFLAVVAHRQEAHGSQRRTGTKIAYLAHLLVVTGLVIEDGSDEDQAIAAILHDSVEDRGVARCRKGSARSSDEEWERSSRAAPIRWTATRRPGPLTEDLWRAVGELAWLVARGEAQHESPDARPLTPRAPAPPPHEPAEPRPYRRHRRARSGAQDPSRSQARAWPCGGSAVSERRS
jgi:HD domain